AGGELELNAAARLGGKRDDGRSLQGIVLRQDFERGVRNEGGALAYAAIELHDPASGKRLSLGVGTEATTMEARVVRWGFVTTRPLAEITLLDDASVPVDRDALRKQLGATHVFAPLAGYRKELARRLFGSERQYDDAVRFWGMAKAYREIVAGARDFGALFMRLLPAPDTGVFDEILRTLHAIDDLEVALRDLDAQAGYVRGLVELVRDVATNREAGARYRWLACLRERDETAERADRATAEAVTWRETELRLGADVDAARLRSERSADALRRAESDDAAGVLGAVREAEVRRNELSVEVARAQHAVAAANRDREAAARIATVRRAELGRVARVAADELIAAVADVGELPGDLAAVHRIGEALERLSDRSGAPLADGAEAIRAVDVLARSANDAAIAARVGAQVAESARTIAASTLAGIETTTEVGPAMPDYAAARRALGDAGIAARAIYELLEPASDADPALLAAIEALAGEDLLGALLVAEPDRERARTIVAAVAPSVRVVIATDAAVRVPAWCERAIGADGGVSVASDADDARSRSVALQVLAAELIQSPTFGEVEAPGTSHDAILRGLGFRVAAESPRLLGAEARRRGHAAKLQQARVTYADTVRASDEANRRVAAAQTTIDRVHRLHLAIRAATGADLAAAWHGLAAADHRVDLAVRTVGEIERTAREATERVSAIDVHVAALRARIDGVDLDELERRLAELRGACTHARTAWEMLLAQRASASAEAGLADTRSKVAIERVADLEVQLADAARVLRTCLAALGSDAARADDEKLAQYVRITQRGDSFRSIDTLRQRITDVERATEAAADELERDGSRGVRCLAHASRFGLLYDRARNHIEDRRGQPIAGVLAELERSIEEQRSVVNERTRALMDTLVMGELARHLQGQIHHLHETIKGINRVLRGLRFGPSEYQFQVTPRADRVELVELVRRLSILDEASRSEFRAWIDARLDELRATDDDEVPSLLDYRQWFEFKLRMSTTDAEGVELTHRLRQVGSGGEQGVPNYLLVLALAKLMFDAAGATVRPLLFDEAFYGIDAGRRDQLLRLATDLGLQLCVASPDQDGATASVRAATTLFVVKDSNHDVHLAPYHYWNHGGEQRDLFEAAPSAPEAAECRSPLA
ncbi:MAG: SbcC/MukB-like Walker B domain-containing protein, partial [Kofleriaceae bacterium]